MTFEDAFRKHLAGVNHAYAEWFKIIADPEFVNRGNSAWVYASDELKAAVDAVFRLKAVWMESGEKPVVSCGGGDKPANMVIQRLD